MRKMFVSIAAFGVLAACTGDDPNRNNEGPFEGKPMDSSPSVRDRSTEVPENKQRPYADDQSTEQTTAAPPDPAQ
ncbi:hypothetical protein JM946_18795 [Steroidobacter sp. S1-65]|uniref:Lipoprotein n=1 Tax=Steroidobacter gossypii TaxID=2805490 RepID=A0ABS1X0L8_9GAMM|nr:hypothetical protein [Steroidobacter gossypii]MBM0106786.1 hypothetical protein [Steroidobacter gossypii]